VLPGPGAGIVAPPFPPDGVRRSGPMRAKRCEGRVKKRCAERCEGRVKNQSRAKPKRARSVVRSSVATLAAPSVTVS
jgi:hypothetical protein